MNYDYAAIAEVMSLDDVSLDVFDPAHVTAEYVSWINNPAVVRYTEARWMSHTLESARAYVSSAANSSKSKLFRICLDSVHVGNLRLSAIDRLHRRAEVALLIGEASARGRGVGPKAITIAAAHAFSTMSLVKLTAGIYEPNQASESAFRKAGFHKVATLRNHFSFEGRYVDGTIVELMSPFSGVGQ